jgi:hypothetical protein
MREATLGPMLVVDGRIDVGIGPHLAQLEEHPFGATDIEQKVVHQRDSRCRQIRQRMPRSQVYAHGPDGVERIA